MPRSRDEFDEFAQLATNRLRRAFRAAYGPDRASEATAEAMAYAWEHWERVASMDNPVGYLYRVGQSRSRWRTEALAEPQFPDVPVELTSRVDPRLPSALAQLSVQQRLCVLLVHSGQWTIQEVADLLETSRSTVQTHVDRGMRRLRTTLGDDDDERPRLADPDLRQLPR